MNEDGRRLHHETQSREKAKSQFNSEDKEDLYLSSTLTQRKQAKFGPLMSPPPFLSSNLSDDKNKKHLNKHQVIRTN